MNARDLANGMNDVSGDFHLNVAVIDTSTGRVDRSAVHLDELPGVQSRPSPPRSQAMPHRLAESLNTCGILAQ
jgi:hypothetical protein